MLLLFKFLVRIDINLKKRQTVIKDEKNSVFVQPHEVKDV